ncbi:HARBI1 [Mytilus coruscus]|uniref:HARBI1 n=1 Tax=Mytilus coruscus TaxID=42192 RepID=A0A6J8C283_MYTCO|nr:HARBI1 [Mytilus coruscus]
MIYYLQFAVVPYLITKYEAQLESKGKKTELSYGTTYSFSCYSMAESPPHFLKGDTLGYDKGTVSRVVSNVTESLIEMKDDFVRRPTDADSIDRIKCCFYRQCNFSNVLGCTDCTHVRIQATSDDEPSYVNRKMYHSITVQAVCDYEGRFTNIYANWPGSTHDSHIFNTSTQITDATNHRCDKSQMRQITGVKMKPEKICRIFGACPVLHNIALFRCEPLVNEDCDVRLDQLVQVTAFLEVQDERNIREHVVKVFVSN